MTTNFRACLGIAFLLVVVSSKLTDAKCLDTDKMEKDWDDYSKEYKLNWTIAVQKKCADDNKETNEEVNKKCAEEKMTAADKKCNDKDDEDRKKIVQCLKKELGVEVNKPQWSFDEFVEHMLTYVTDKEKTDSMKNTMQECKNEECDWKRWWCSLQKLAAGPCPELKAYNEAMEKEWSSGSYTPSAFDY